MLLAALTLSACGAGPGPERYGPPPAAPEEVTALARTIQDLGPGIDPAEAARAAEIAHAHARQLARDYRVTDPPLVHNTKVNMGLRDRGLCYQWAEDMEARLGEEGFRTLQLHRAISPGDRLFRIDHSTVILSRRGDPMEAGVVLDPWRSGGELFWSRTTEDPKYAWRPRAEVLAEKAAAAGLTDTASTRNMTATAAQR
ncbi:hypothetical protein GH815_13340 [Rhodovulum strictum]|uniref:Uncharacterized protein n=2 Tax=Rhodovulum strictum TaxID=58314 RepID=A0A844BHK5_9RHOB|nr:hypothetical protein [Rhodovulum strictum]MRH21978.1 hypothetical protein [Rhodovulum strictum]